MSTTDLQIAYVRRVKAKTERMSKAFSLNYNKSKLVHLLFKRFPPDHVMKILEIKKAVMEMYPDEWDIQFDFEAVFKLHENRYGGGGGAPTVWQVFDRLRINHIYFIIHFPSLTMTNSSRVKHELRDTYVKIPLYASGSKLLIGVLSGTRATLSLAEWEAKYQHSHLVRVLSSVSSAITGAPVLLEPCEYSKFCVGAGDIGTLISQLNAEFDINVFKAYLLLIQTFLEWESIEGVPYIRVSEVGNHSYDYPDFSVTDCDNFYANVRRAIVDNVISVSANWRFNEDERRYEIIDDERFEGCLCTMNYTGAYEAYYLYRDAAGEYYVQRETTQQQIQHLEQLNYWLPFRGRKIMFKVEGEVRVIDPNQTKFLHPKIKRYVKRRLEQQANLTFIKEIGTRRVGEGGSP